MYYITYPKSIKPTTFCCKINSDDMTREPAKKFLGFLRKKGLKVKKSIQYSQTKAMHWHTFKIEAEKHISSFKENIDYCSSLVNEFLEENNFNLRKAS